MTDALQDALASIAGVAAAEVELSDEGPLSVRVRLAPGADEPAVAASVQRILEEHGLRSRVAPARRPPQPDTPPPPPRTSGYGITPPSAPGRPTPDAPEAKPEEVDGVGPAAEADRVGEGIALVAVEQSPGGATIRVTGRDGRSVVRRARPSFRAVDEAVVSAVGELVDPGAPAPGLVTVEEGAAHLTVVVEVADASIRVGAALLGQGRSFALAQAAWVALRGRQGG